MKKGGGKAAAFLAVPVIVEDVWAQCDRCNKWRRLPPGSVVDETRSWCAALRAATQSPSASPHTTAARRRQQRSRSLPPDSRRIDHRRRRRPRRLDRRRRRRDEGPARRRRSARPPASTARRAALRAHSAAMRPAER
jgi:hypothetical protein